MNRPAFPYWLSPSSDARMQRAALRRFLRIAAWCCLALLLVSPAKAGTTGAIIGYVTAPDESPLADVQVTVQSATRGGALWTTTTRADGRFTFPYLPGEELLLSLVSDGYSRIERRPVRVRRDVSHELRIRMTPLASPRTHAPPPTARDREESLDDRSSTALRTILAEELVQRLPTTRTYLGLPAFVPGVVDSIGTSGGHIIHGGTVYGNLYLLDGFNITEPALQLAQRRLNFDVIDQAEILTGGLDAEYGAATGGVVHVETRTGSDEFHLDGSVYSQPERLQWREPDEGSFSEGQSVNLAVNGPILRRRLWFHLSTVYADELTQRTPGLMGEEQIPIPPQTQRSLALLGKLDWQPAAWQRFSLLLHGDPSWVTNTLQRPQVAPDAERQGFQGGATLGLRSVTRLAPETQWQTQISYFAEHEQVLPMSGDLDLPGHLLEDTGEATVNDTLFADDWRLRLQMSSSLAHLLDGFIGEHQLKVGIEGALSSNWRSAGYPGGEIFIDRLGEQGELEPHRVERLLQPLATRSSAIVTTVYAQDVWRPTRGLTLRPGLRYEFGRADTEGARGETPVYAVSWLSPRIGAAWDPWGDGKTVLRAGYFQYADMGFLALANVFEPAMKSARYEYNPVTAAYDIPLPDTSTEGLAVATESGEPPVTHEWMLGAERAFTEHAVASAHIVVRRTNHMWASEEINRIWEDTGQQSIGTYDGSGRAIYQIGPSASATRDYAALEAKLERRLADGWAMFATYTLARLQGSLEGFLDASLDQPTQRPFQYGFLADDVRHTGRVSATYELPLGLCIGATGSYQTGRPYERLYFNPVAGAYVDRRAPRGFDPGADLEGTEDDRELRLPDQFSLHARALWNLRSLTEQNIDLIMDVFNVLNARPVTRVEQRNLDSGFGEPLAVAQPLAAQLGLRYRF